MTALKMMTVANMDVLSTFHNTGRVVCSASSVKKTASSDISISESLFCRHWMIIVLVKAHRSSTIALKRPGSPTFSAACAIRRDNGPIDDTSGLEDNHCSRKNVDALADQLNFLSATWVMSASMVPKKYPDSSPSDEK